MRTINIVVSLLVLTAAVFSQEEGTQPLKAGNVAPVFSLPSLDGNRVALRVWCGEKLLKPYVNKVSHTVILSFWATYCEPCRKEIPELIKFYNKYKNENLKIFLISLDQEGASVVNPFVKKNKYTLPVLLDPYKRTSERYGIKSLPSLVVIGPDQIIRYSSSGYSDASSFAQKLENVYAKVKKGESTDEQVKGESVEVKETAAQEPPEKEAVITPKQKWMAVMKLENGMPCERIAEKYSVKSEEIKAWREELKNAAIDLWAE